MALRWFASLIVKPRFYLLILLRALIWRFADRASDAAP